MKGIEEEFEKLCYLEKRNEVCFLFPFFLQQIMKKSEDLQELFLSKFETLMSYAAYIISSENILKQMETIQTKISQFGN